MNISQIATILKREYPMLLLDGVTHIEPRVLCRAYKNLTYNEWFFPEHFPNHPIMPGSLQIEAFTQAVALPLLVEEDASNLSVIPLLLAGVDRVRFYKAVLPGYRFEICVQIERIAMGIATASATGSVNNEIVSECKITYKITGGE
jgi:3-hydroxymyristoyl/3-hydroxydecanoyl-(acyl carrier protein) dehydratase